MVSGRRSKAVWRNCICIFVPFTSLVIFVPEVIINNREHKFDRGKWKNSLLADGKLSLQQCKERSLLPLHQIRIDNCAAFESGILSKISLL